MGGLIGLVVIFAATGCAPTGHTIEPYQSDPLQARALELRAEEACRLTQSIEGDAIAPRLPPRTFVTDGCSSWPDTDATVPCCVEHDIEYWCGGSATARLAADDRFGQCVAENTKSSFTGAFMRFGVRAGGHPFFPFHYRWGYGWPYQGGYPQND